MLAEREIQGQFLAVGQVPFRHRRIGEPALGCFELVVARLKASHCERSVGGAYECLIDVVAGIVGDDLSPRDRRSGCVLHQSAHLRRGTKSKPKTQDGHRDRSHTNEGESDQSQFSPKVAPGGSPMACRIMRTCGAEINQSSGNIAGEGSSNRMG